MASPHPAARFSAPFFLSTPPPPLSPRLPLFSLVSLPPALPPLVPPPSPSAVFFRHPFLFPGSPRRSVLLTLPLHVLVRPKAFALPLAIMFSSRFRPSGVFYFGRTHPSSRGGYSDMIISGFFFFSLPVSLHQPCPCCPLCLEATAFFSMRPGPRGRQPDFIPRLF